MKGLTFFILSLLVIIGLTSLTPNNDRKWDWKSITDKDCIVTYVKVIADSSSQYAIDNGVRIYSTNDGARVLTKNSVKLLKQLLMDSANFKEASPSPTIPKTFSNAVVVMSRNQIVGIINIDGKGQCWNFEPRHNSQDVMILNEKGVALKEELFKWRDK